MKKNGNKAELIKITFLFILLSICLTSASVLNVCNSGCEYDSIQKAVDNASSKDTINVFSGNYDEYQIIINKSLKIIGEGANKTIINGGRFMLLQPGLIRIITDEDIEISGFTIKNAGKTGEKRIGIYGNSSSNGSYKIIHNNIYDSVLWEGDGLLNAAYNWWGGCENPGSRIDGNVIFNPWIGVCVIGNSIDKECITSTDKAILRTSLSSGECIGSVKFQIRIPIKKNGVFTNDYRIEEGSISGGIENYSYTLDLKTIDKTGTIYWKVYASDCHGHVSEGNENRFYINQRTRLRIIPSEPDGKDRWYISKPIFVLENTDASEIFYRWDGLETYVYNTGFGLQDTPNNGNKTGGILKLNYWSDVCGGEAEQSKFLNLDFTKPLITNLVPPKNGIVYNDLKPKIEALLDEKYAGNSGIDKNSVVMLIDGNKARASILSSGAIDAIARYNPFTELSMGEHNISIYVLDKAGNENILSWKFYINTTAIFNLSVYSLLNQVYPDKGIVFNITTDSEVKSIEYINWKDKTPRWKPLCTKCKEFGSLRTKKVILLEGWNNITIKASDKFGNSKEKNISLFIDSKKPEVLLVKPQKNLVFNGSFFYIKYTEENLKNIALFYGKGEEIMSMTNKSCESGKNKECLFNVNLSFFNKAKIIYWFNISDASRSIGTKAIEINVDTNSPILEIKSPVNNFTYDSVYKGSVLFDIKASEKVTMDYYDYSALYPRWVRLCINCDKYFKVKRFSAGEHRVAIKAVDKAGNSFADEKKFRVM